MNPQDNEDLVRRIHSYLSDHENAADSLHGIAQWWLGEKQGAYRLCHVEEALNELIKRRVVQKETNVDGTVIYKRARR